LALIFTINGTINKKETMLFKDSSREKKFVIKGGRGGGRRR